MSQSENTFAQDVAFLREHVETVVLQNEEGAAVAVVPQYQGRTMTSCSNAQDGTSYGYINYDAIRSETVDPKINLYGGEDRVWISPEGGQYSIFFDPKVEMSFENWRTPPVLDTKAFDITHHDDASIAFRKQADFKNWTGTDLKTIIERKVCLLGREDASKHLDFQLSDLLQLGCHESHNTLHNAGESAWEQESGLIGIWMLCMSKPAPKATLMVPFIANESELESSEDKAFVNGEYFGKLEQDRLLVDRSSKLIYFRGDGQHRSKLGLTFDRVTPTLGSWDPSRKVLSIVQFNLPNEAPNGYNNNLWELQDEPYAGDVINCYNDGLNESGSSLAAGGFYELETISPALALKAGDSYTHVHRTIRMEARDDSSGGRQALSDVASHVFGVSIEEIEAKLP